MHQICRLIKLIFFQTSAIRNFVLVCSMNEISSLLLSLWAPVFSYYLLKNVKIDRLNVHV